MAHDPKTRHAPLGLTLPVPLYVRLVGGALGLVTMLLGLIYLLVPPDRPRELERVSVVTVLEPVLGWVMLTAGGWVLLATATATARASAHLVAAVTHGLYLCASIASFLLTAPPRPTPVAVLALGVFIAHGGACLAYWQRGWR